MTLPWEQAREAVCALVSLAALLGVSSRQSRRQTTARRVCAVDGIVEFKSKTLVMTRKEDVSVKLCTLDERFKCG